MQNAKCKMQNENAKYKCISFLFTIFFIINTLLIIYIFFNNSNRTLIAIIIDIPILSTLF